LILFSRQLPLVIAIDGASKPDLTTVTDIFL
jgi:hypothetical protein